MRMRTARPLSRVFQVVSWLALLGIALLGAGSIAWRLYNASQHLSVFAVQALAKAMKREVRVGRVDVLKPGTVDIADLRIAAGRTFREGRLLFAPHTVVRYNFWDMLRGRVDPVGSIASVDIYDPELLIVRDQNNRFNLQDLFPKQKKPPKPTTFRGIARIRDAVVVFRDYAVRDLDAPQENTLTLSVTVDGSAPPLLLISAQGSGDGRHVTTAACEGTYNPGNGAMRLAITTGTNDAAYMTRYFAKLPSLTVLSGRGSVSVDVWKPRAFEYATAAISTSFENATGTTPLLKAPLEDVHGTFSLRTGQPLPIALDATGRAGRIPVHVYGSIFTGPNPRVALQAVASDVTLPALRQVAVNVPSLALVEPLAPANVVASIYGPTSNLMTLATVQVPRARVYQSILNDVTAQVRYNNRVVGLPSIVGTADGQRVTASGEINLNTKAIQLAADVPNVSVRSLGLNKLPLTGSVASRLVLSGTTAAPKTSAIVTVVNGRFRNIPFQKLAARVSMNGKRISIENAVGTLPGAVVRASGTATTAGALDISLNAAGIQLARLMPSLGYRNVSGTGFFEGRVTGTATDPIVQGKAQIFGLNMQGQRLDLVSGPVTWRGDRVTLGRTLVARYPAQGIVQGSVTLRPNQPLGLNLTARLDTARLESLLADQHMDFPALGHVTGRATISGTLRSPVVQGYAALDDATVRGLPIQSTSVRFRLARGVVEVPALEARSEGAQLRVANLRVGEKVVSGRFEATGIPLSRIPQPAAPYATLDGTVDVLNGRLGGTRRHPTASATIQAAHFAVNDLPFENVSTRVAWDGQAARIVDLTMFQRGTKVVSAPLLRWDRATNQVNGELLISDLRASDIVVAAEKSPYVQGPDGYRVRDALAKVRGSVQAGIRASLSFSGSFKDLTADASLSLTGDPTIRIGPQTFDTVTLHGGIRNGVIADGRLQDALIEVPADGLEITSGKDLVVRGQFRGRLSKTIEVAKLDANSVPIASLMALLPTRRLSERLPAQLPDFGGLVNTFTVTAEGEVKSPQVRASLDADLIYAPNRPDKGERIHIGTEAITANADRIVINGIRITARGHGMDAQGSLPVDWKTLSIPPDKTLSFVARLKKQDVNNVLGIIMAATGPLPVKTASGQVAGDVELTGTLQDARVTGDLSLEDGKLELTQLANGFRNINTHIHFANKVYEVQDLNIESTAGGSVVAVKGSHISQVSGADVGSRLVSDVTLAFKDFRLEEEPSALHLGERVRGTVNGQVAVKNTVREPLLGGTLSFADVEIIPPNRTVAANSNPAPYPIVPAFDLNLIGGRNVWVRTPLFRVKLDEQAAEESRRVHIGGTLDNPTARGQLVSREGTFSFPTARFTLTNAVVDVIYPAPGNPRLEPPPYRIDADAQARLFATISGRRQPITAYLHIEGPMSRGLRQISDTGTGFQTLADYNISLRSSPSLPERQLLALMTREESLTLLAQGGATAQDVLRQEAANILQTSVLPEALTGFESSISRIFGFESFNVDYLAGDRAVSLTATKRFGHNLILTYALPLGATGTSGANAYDIRLSYEIPRTRLRLTLEQQRGPYLTGGLLTGVPVPTVPGAQPTIKETSILLEGGFNF